jgi:quercetin dioxygenase-like cupin family protein
MLKKLTFVLWTVAVYAAATQNPTHVRPESYKIEIDNPQVQVTRSFHAPHEVVPMHSHKDAVVVYLSDVHEKSTYPDGTSKEITHHAGDVIWSPAHTHALENLANEPIRVIEIEPKEPSRAATGSQVRSK